MIRRNLRAVGIAVFVGGVIASTCQSVKLNQGLHLVMNDTEAMRLAIAKAREGIAAGQAPFGAVIVQGGAAVATEHNAVWRQCDPTAHAEIRAIRQAAAKLRTIDLSGCTMFTTCEPCPMCLAATHWAKIDRIVFGATIAQAEAAGFTELRVGALELVRLGGSRLVVDAGPCCDECVRLFEEWAARGQSPPY